MMSSSWYKKGLVVGIIVLFIGMGVQPAFAIESRTSVNTVQLEEDCECEIVDEYNPDKLIQLLNEVKVYVNNILLNFGHIPYVKEKCEEILDAIESFTGWEDTPILCAILYGIGFSVFAIGVYFRIKFDETGMEIYYFLGIVLAVLGFQILGIAMYDFDCEMPIYDHINNIEMQKIVSQNLVLEVK